MKKNYCDPAQKQHSKPSKRKRKASLEQLMAELNGCLTSIEEIFLPDIHVSLREIERLCDAGWKLSHRVQKRLGFFDKRGA